jgi:hypothetical protein
MAELHTKLHELAEMAADGAIDFDEAVAIVQEDYPSFDYATIVDYLTDVFEVSENA